MFITAIRFASTGEDKRLGAGTGKKSEGPNDRALQIGRVSEQITRARAANPQNTELIRRLEERLSALHAGQS